MKKKYSAFSLIEISVVILVIGILIAGVSSGIDLYADAKLTKVRNLTISSRVGRIPDLVAWYETTLKKNFSTGTSTYQDVENITKNTKINRWKDINPVNTKPNNAIQNTANNQPIIIIDNDTLLPMVNFTGASSQFLSLPDGTVPFGNSEYTVILVSRLKSVCTCNVLSSGEFNNGDYRNNTFGYDGDGTFKNYWWNSDFNAGSYIVNQLNIVVITYDLFQRMGYLNGALKSTKTDSIARSSTKINNRIGRSSGSADYFTGDIGEIIIYDRALNNSERKDIENYLAKKWEIKI